VTLEHVVDRNELALDPRDVARSLGVDADEGRDFAAEIVVVEQRRPANPSRAARTVRAP
jgi:hypothetical protein